MEGSSSPGVLRVLTGLSRIVCEWLRMFFDRLPKRREKDPDPHGEMSSILESR
jgi:hypothetical protein